MKLENNIDIFLSLYNKKYSVDFGVYRETMKYKFDSLTKVYTDMSIDLTCYIEDFIKTVDCSGDPTNHEFVLDQFSNYIAKLNVCKKNPWLIILINKSAELGKTKDIAYLSAMDEFISEFKHVMTSNDIKMVLCVIDKLRNTLLKGFLFKKSERMQELILMPHVYAICACLGRINENESRIALENAIKKRMVENDKKYANSDKKMSAKEQEVQDIKESCEKVRRETSKDYLTLFELANIKNEYELNVVLNALSEQDLDMIYLNFGFNLKGKHRPSNSYSYSIVQKAKNIINLFYLNIPVEVISHPLTNNIFDSFSDYSKEDILDYLYSYGDDRSNMEVLSDLRFITSVYDLSTGFIKYSRILSDEDKVRIYYIFRNLGRYINSDIQNTLK